jgi:hypothetical protein
VVLFDETDAGSFVPVRPILGIKIKVKPCVVGEHTKPKSLRSPVAVNEGMTRVYLVDIPRRLGGEIFLAPRNKIAVTRKLREQVFHPRFDIRWHCKRNRSSASRVISFASCPLIEVLKKVAMNGLEPA